MKKKRFLKNALVLTATGLLLRFAGILFKIWLAGTIGSEGIGLYQLVFSVYALVSTFASCGISTAVTRLVTDELVLGSESTVKRILKYAVFVSLSIAVATLIVVFFGSDFIASGLIGDSRAASALRMLSFSLPFMGISSCLKGYFIARRKTAPHSFSQILEQTVRIIICVVMLLKFAPLGIDAAAAAVLFADMIAEGASCFLIYIFYRIDKKHLNDLLGRKTLPYRLGRKFGAIAFPIAGGRYLNSLLRTAENILVPKALSRGALGTSESLSIFGNIKGMALPILFFPSSLLNAVSMLLIPEMSEFTARGDKAGLRSATNRMISLTFVFSAIATAVFLMAGNEIGTLIYSDKQVGRLLMILAPLVPFMYLDSVADGMLKGLGEQFITFRNSILDSSLRIIMVLSVVPIFGLNGFVGIMYFSNLFTALLNLWRLLKVAKLKIDFISVFLIPSLTAAVSALLARLISMPLSSNMKIKTIVFCLLSVSIYILFGILFGFFGFGKEDIANQLRRRKNSIQKPSN